MCIRDSLYPDQFLPLAEAAGLMPALTIVVLDQALRQCAAWRAGGVELSVAVNLSASDLLDAELPSLVHALLANLDLPSSALQLEITETVLMSDRAKSIQVLERLSQSGLRVAIHRPDERLVELEVVNGQLREVGERGVARAVVVDGDSQPRLAEAFDYLNALRTIAHQDRFGDLQMERGGWQVEVRQKCVDERWQFGVQQVGRRQVDSDAEFDAAGAPCCALTQRLVEHHGGQRRHEAGGLCKGQELVGVEKAAVRMLPAHERLDTGDLPGR